MKYTWVDIFLKTLKENWVDKIYGYPWWANIPFYDKLNHIDDIKHYLVRHEQAAAFAAQGQSRTNKWVWVCLVTSWPGAANALTWVFDAYMDSVPMIFITAQVPYSVMWSDVFQEMDTIWATMSFVKHSFLVKDVNLIPKIINESFRLATEWRPWPVHIDLPKDIQNNIYTWDLNITWYKKEIEKKEFEIKKESIQEIIKYLNNSKKPLLLVWNWVKLSNALEELETFVNILQIPTVSTLHAKWSLREDNKNYLQMIWMHWFYHANMATANADLIINIWSRFDDRIVWTYDSFAKDAKVIHIDIDKSELNKLVKTDIAINSDAKFFLRKILDSKLLKKLKIEDWKQQIDLWNKTNPYEKSTKDFSVKNSLQIINKYSEKNLDNFIFVTDVWQHQMWSTQILKVASPFAWLTSWWSWTMWFALPTAIWASISNPEKTVVVIAWDWWIQMNIQELQLLKDYDLNIKVIIINNSFLWMVRQWQDLFYDKNYASTPISSPNFKGLWEAYWLVSYSTDNEKGLDEILKKEFSKRWACLLEIKINKNEENIFPMVAPWTSLKDTLVSN